MQLDIFTILLPLSNLAMNANDNNLILIDGANYHLNTSKRITPAYNKNYIPLKPYFKDIYSVIYLISGRYWVITTC